MDSVIARLVSIENDLNNIGIGPINQANFPSMVPADSKLVCVPFSVVQDIISLLESANGLVFQQKIVNRLMFMRATLASLASKVRELRLGVAQQVGSTTSSGERINFR